MYDIETNETISVPNRLTEPRIYGNKVIGTNDYTGFGFIQMYDTDTKESIDITSDISWDHCSQAGDDTGFFNDIYGDKIVHAKTGNDQFGNAGLYVYNISSGQSTQIINYPEGTYTTPKIFDNTVVWGVTTTYTGNIDDIYVCNLTAPVAVQPPTASFMSDAYNFDTKWDSYGSEDGQFYHPWGIAVDSSDNVYFVDNKNSCIQKFDSNGKFVTKWGSRGCYDSGFRYPYNVAVDSSGSVYVSDTGYDRIQKFDSNGTLITEWCSSGSEDGQFSYPSNVAVDFSVVFILPIPTIIAFRNLTAMVTSLLSGVHLAAKMDNLMFLAVSL